MLGGWGAVGRRLTPWGSLRPLWARMHLGKEARPPGGLREGGSAEGPPQRRCAPPAPAWPATVRATGACPASDGASPRHLPGRFLHSAHSLQPTRPHPVRCRFRPDPASSFNSQTRLPAPASLTLTSHGTHPRSSVSSRPGPGHARHTPVHAHSSGRLAWPLLREACVDTLAGGIRGQ